MAHGASSVDPCFFSLVFAPLGKSLNPFISLPRTAANRIGIFFRYGYPPFTALAHVRPIAFPPKTNWFVLPLTKNCQRDISLLLRAHMTFKFLPPPHPPPRLFSVQFPLSRSRFSERLQSFNSSIGNVDPFFSCCDSILDVFLG